MSQENEELNPCTSAPTSADKNWAANPVLILEENGLSFIFGGQMQSTEKSAEVVKRSDVVLLWIAAHGVLNQIFWSFRFGPTMLGGLGTLLFFIGVGEGIDKQTGGIGGRPRDWCPYCLCLYMAWIRCSERNRLAVVCCTSILSS